MACILSGPNLSASPSVSSCSQRTSRRSRTAKPSGLRARRRVAMISRFFGIGAQDRTSSPSLSGSASYAVHRPSTGWNARASTKPSTDPRHLERSAAVAAAGASGRQPSMGALDDQLALELGQRRGDAEHQATVRRRGVEVGALAGQHLEAHAIARALFGKEQFGSSIWPISGAACAVPLGTTQPCSVRALGARRCAACAGAPTRPAPGTPSRWPAAFHSLPQRSACLAVAPLRLRIGHVVLLALHERLDIGGRDQPGRVAQPANSAAPVMGASAGFQCHHAPGLGRKELHQLAPGDLLAEHDAPRRVSVVRLAHVLRNVQTNRADLRRGRLLQVAPSTPPLWHMMPSGASTSSVRLS